MGGESHVVSLLVIVSVSIVVSGSAAAAGGPGQQPLATIHVMNAMPKGWPAMQIQCNSDKTECGRKEALGVGEDYECGVEEKALYYCDALSGRQFASWHGFQPRRDGNHKAVFWLVKPQGFFLSWDNSTWVKKSQWLNE